MNHKLVSLLVAAGMLVSLLSNPVRGLARLAPPPPTATPDHSQAIRQALEDALAAAATAAVAPGYLLYETRLDHLQVSAGGDWATAWLVPVDPQTGEVVPAEPGLAVVQQVGSDYQVWLPGAAGWRAAVEQAPGEVLSDPIRQEWLSLSQRAEAEAQAPAAPLTGYLLPYDGGAVMALTQSVGHDRYTADKSAHYSFDFAPPSGHALFGIYAARGGVVKRFQDTVPNDNHDNTNYLVLEDTSTSPTTYQLYLHLAQGTIPAGLKVIGAQVTQGQFLAMADNTGNSTGTHLHFQVQKNLYVPYWGISVDIVFNDVAINGGRPRISSDLAYCLDNSTYQDVCDQTQSLYVSGNVVHADRVPPAGGISNLVNGSTVTNASLHLAGWAADDTQPLATGLASAQLQARYNNAWHMLTPAFTTNEFSLDWDWCAAGVPDGPVALALSIQDKAGNPAKGLPGLVTVFKHAACATEPPACTPTASQVALFSAPAYQGACVVLGAGSYTSSSSLGSLGVDRAQSIQVGANAQATLYSGSNLRGRGEAFFASDANLGDNVIYTNTVSSLLVQAASAAPSAPVPAWPAGGSVYSDTASLNLVWDNGGGASEYQARLQQGGSTLFTSPWQAEPSWQLGNLPAGVYTWQVKARNPNGESAWSAASGFSTQASLPALPATPVYTAPYTATVEDLGLNWIADRNWDLTTTENHTPDINPGISWMYDPNGTSGYSTGAPNMGDLTSPAIRVPAGGTYYLRFWYDHETESPGRHWDQRWVQISVNGGAFTNLLLLSDDPPRFWLRSPAISLAPYAGQVVRLRFHFATLDALLNAYKGWYLDDFSITSDSPPACAADGNDQTAGATSIAYTQSVPAAICPGGDLDYYRFTGQAGEVISATTQAQSAGSRLDTVLTLLDSDGLSRLALNDDTVPYTQTDSILSYALPANGTYYLKVQAWDHPSVGGPDYFYSLRLNASQPSAMLPEGHFVYPTYGANLPAGPATFQVAASSPLGISHVQFFLHGSNWQSTDWTLLGEDWTAADGWKVNYTCPDISASGLALYARLWDAAGSFRDVSIWNLSIQQARFYLPIIGRQR